MFESFPNFITENLLYLPWKSVENKNLKSGVLAHALVPVPMNSGG